VLYPAVPPWLAAKQHQIGGVLKIKDQMFAHTGTKAIASAVEKNWVDQTAAMPSLHAAFPLMMMLLFWHKGWRWRSPFALYALAMGLTLVYTGEHFAVDVFVGWAYALIIYFAATRYWRWRERRAEERAEREAPPPGSPDGASAEPPPRSAEAEQPATAVSYSGGPGARPGSG
jgi:membrane-associated phospholipid phosphatase